MVYCLVLKYDQFDIVITFAHLLFAGNCRKSCRGVWGCNALACCNTLRLGGCCYIVGYPLFTPGSLHPSHTISRNFLLKCMVWVQHLDIGLLICELVIVSLYMCVLAGHTFWGHIRGRFRGFLVLKREMWWLFCRVSNNHDVLLYVNNR